MTAIVDLPAEQAGLRPEHFHRPGHGTIYAAMVALHDTDRHVDPLTLAAVRDHGATACEYVNEMGTVDRTSRMMCRHAAGVLNDVALQTQTHGILVCQLNRNNASGVIKPPPVQGDLRNTGAWWDNSTNVLFLHRDQQEREDSEGKGSGIAEPLPEGTIRADKHRHGPGGIAPVVFNARSMTLDRADGWMTERSAA